MTPKKLERLAKRAISAFREGRYKEEAELWEQICASYPERYDLLTNLATARMNTGDYEVALELFDRILEKAPDLSHAHNNRAGTLLRMGVDIQDLLPSFLLALRLSETYDDFFRHAVNLCQAAAFGPDNPKSEIFALVQSGLFAFVEERYPPGDMKAKQKFFWRKFVSAYRHMAEYRSAVARRDWQEAYDALGAAQSRFRDAGLDNFARGVAESDRYLQLCRETFALLEDIASCSDIVPSEVVSQAGNLYSRVKALRDAEPHAAQRRLLDVLVWFLGPFIRQLEYFAGVKSRYQHTPDEIQTLIWLSTASFRTIGDDFIGILNFMERLCDDLQSRLCVLASERGAQQARIDEWHRLALYIHGRVLDFRGVDAALARSVLRWPDNILGKLRAELHEFRAFVERQAFSDIIIDSKPREHIARALLQARLSARNYREVQVRGGRSDILGFSANGKRFLIETKIWRGKEYHEQGLRELAEYVEGESSDGEFVGAFYVVFDPTATAQSIAYEGASIGTRSYGNTSVDIMLVRLRPPTPSRHGKKR